MIVWILSLMVSMRDAEALRSTAARELDVTSAGAHLAASRYAGAAFGVDPDLLLAIAWRESRYRPDAVTRERSGKFSCGLMMVTQPLGAACPAPSILGSYMAGAGHLRRWLVATRSERDALLGYAGGYAMIRRCAQGPLMRGAVDLCSTPELHRAAWIRRARERRATSES